MRESGNELQLHKCLEQVVQRAAPHVCTLLPQCRRLAPFLPKTILSRARPIALVIRTLDGARNYPSRQCTSVPHPIDEDLDIRCCKISRGSVLANVSKAYTHFRPENIQRSAKLLFLGCVTRLWAWGRGRSIFADLCSLYT